MADYGVSSMTGPLRRVLMRRPGAMLSADPERWHYAGPLDGPAVRAQFDALVAVLEGHGVEIDWLPDDDGDGLADSVFTYDPSFITPAGAVVLRPGKGLRRPEADLHRRFYDGRVPIVGAIDAPGVIEGGDCCWLDDATLAVGRGYRTNRSGIEQLTAILADQGVVVESYDLPYHTGPDACLHLLSLVSPLDGDLALVHAPLLPAALHERMTSMGYELLHAPADEFDRSGGLSLNVLAVAPRRVVAIDGFPRTAAVLRDGGCRLDLIGGDALCIPCEGGPTCLTRPLWRD